ncbi:MAG: alginate lyase family protein [Candidatus Marinimicrobia bacterium]|nr:alginate lyase family protein [Candidatus Neomarinimicrobiota bacterium]
MKKLIGKIIFLSLFTILVSAEKTELLTLDFEHLQYAKTQVGRKDEALYPAYRYLLKIADEALTEGPWSVMDKPVTPPSGDKHDYMSLSPYWWPDPEKADGLPYIRRDGEVNPEREKFDKRSFVHVHENALVLAIAYYFSGKEKYAKKSAGLLRTWFINENTKMNPNLNFGQGVPGKEPGRGVGLIEMKNLIDVLDAIILIKDSRYWTGNDQKQMDQWLKDYFRWMQTSPIAKEEQEHKNNHGSWFDVQYAHIAYYLGEYEEAKRILSAFPKERIAHQVKTDGSQPYELERTRAFTYSLFNLRAHMLAAELGKKLNIDIYNYTTSEGAGIRKAIEFLVPYATDTAKWPYRQITSWQKGFNDLYLVLKSAARAYDDDGFEKTAVHIPVEKQRAFLVDLLYPSMKK